MYVCIITVKLLLLFDIYTIYVIVSHRWHGYYTLDQVLLYLHDDYTLACHTDIMSYHVSKFGDIRVGGERIPVNRRHDTGWGYQSTSHFRVN